jgi:hypothetical protein
MDRSEAAVSERTIFAGASTYQPHRGFAAIANLPIGTKL